MTDLLKTDLRIELGSRGADLARSPDDLRVVRGLDNLRQALLLRLLVYQGELAALGHPRYGSRLPDLIGRPLDAANLSRLTRVLRTTLLADPRVASVEAVDALPRGSTGVVDVRATVRAVGEQVLELEVALDVA